MTSDKSKRLVALSAEDYQAMFEEHKQNLDDARSMLPSSTQAAFNKKLMRIANGYRGQFKDKLLKASCCEPLPSRMRCLPKDHKPGVLCGRSIVACVDAPSSNLSIVLSKLLHPLIIAHVPAHLTSTSHFFESYS